jgi:hypothetical protein
MSKETFKLEKTEKLDGSIWFYIMRGSVCLKSIEDDPAAPGVEEKRARRLFEDYKTRESEGYPKTTILDTF